jgi:hypothetical protein
VLQPKAHYGVQIFFVWKWFCANGWIMFIASLGVTEQKVFRVLGTTTPLELVGDPERVN